MRTINHVVDTADDGRQIKRVIRGTLQISHHQFSLLKAAGGLMLDGVSVHANHVVHEGQLISLCLQGETRNASREYTLPKEAGDVHIIYEDADLLVLNKQAPLPTQSSPKQPGGTLENLLAHHFQDDPGWMFRPVNRLDKGTSGLMAVAKNAHAQMLLSRELHTDEFVREYLAIVLGQPSPASGCIDAPIGKADGATVRREVRPDGKCARTHYELVQSSGDVSLVRLRLESGRTHQIRVHMAHIRCPVFGDFLYGEESPHLPGRFALHSAHMELVQPLTGESIKLDAPLPPELSQILVFCPSSKNFVDDSPVNFTE